MEEAINDDNTTGLQIQWYISIGSNSTGGSNGDVWHEYTANKFAFGHVTNTHITTDESTFQLTGVQFELGEVATPFELLPIAEDLAKCQRYFYKYISNHEYGHKEQMVCRLILTLQVVLCIKVNIL